MMIMQAMRFDSFFFFSFLFIYKHDFNVLCEMCIQTFFFFFENIKYLTHTGIMFYRN